MEEKAQVRMPRVGDVALGTVVKVFQSYAIMLFDDGWTGLLHISELSHSYIRHFTSFVTIGSLYSVKVISIDEDTNKVHVSLKQMNAGERRRSFAHKEVAKEDISFDTLRSNLPRWIEQQNKEI